MFWVFLLLFCFIECTVTSLFWVALICSVISVLTTRWRQTNILHRTFIYLFIYIQRVFKVIHHNKNMKEKYLHLQSSYQLRQQLADLLPFLLLCSFPPVWMSFGTLLPLAGDVQRQTSCAALVISEHHIL